MKKTILISMFLVSFGCDDQIDVADLNKLDAVDTGEAEAEENPPAEEDGAASKEEWSVDGCGPGAPKDAVYLARFTAGSDAECEGMDQGCVGIYYETDGVAVQKPALPSGALEMTPNCGLDDYVFCTRTAETSDEWGVVLQLVWGAADDLPAVASLAGYKGVGFFAGRRSGPSEIAFGINSVYDWPGFGYCSEDNGKTEDDCYNTFSQDVTMDGVKTWQYHEVLFEDLDISPYWGLQQDEFAQSESVGLSFTLRMSPEDSDEDYDFCIDDLFLIPAD